MNLIRLLKWKERRQIYSNIIFLSFLQATNYLIPLMAIPYLVRVLGDERFGLVMFAQAFMQYFMIIVDFGFELTATREMSIHRSDRQKMSEIFSCVMSIKALLLLVSLIGMSGVIFTLPQFRGEWELYLLSFGMVVGQMLFPIWYFQGIERMGYVMYINLFSKTFFTILIFLTIHQPEDYRMYAIVNSAGYLLAGILSLVVALKMGSFSFIPISRQTMMGMIRKTRDVFVSNVGGSLYMTSTPFLLGIMTGRNDLVGYYTVAEKTVRGIRYSITPLTQALFPYLSKRFLGESPLDSIRVLSKLLKYLTPILLLLVAFVLVYANRLTLLLTGGVNLSTVLNMRILSGILLVGTYNNILGVLGMVNLGMEAHFRNSVLVCGLFNVVAAMIGSHFLLDVGASLSVLLTEIVLASMLIFHLYRKSRNV